MVGVLPLTRAAGRASELRPWISDSLVPALMSQHGVVAARYAEKNPQILALGTAEHLRPTDRYIDSVLMIEAIFEADLAGALPLLEREAFAARGAEPEQLRRLSVMYTLHVPPHRVDSAR